jgi:outer membrane protein assembly complex protein YaeT
MLMVRWRLALSFVILVFAAAAQEEKYDGKTIAGILFEPAVQPLDANELSKILPLRTGQPLRRAELRASIDRLFATGRYADIQVDAQPADGGVIIRFLTKNSWFVGNVDVTGANSGSPNPSQLENATQLNLGQPYTEAKLEEAIESQKRLLESNGLYRPRIHTVFDYDPQYQQVHIRFEVDSGPRARFATPVLQGEPKMDPERILKATKWRRWLVNTWKPVTQTRVRDGLDGIRSLYQKENRLEARVSLESMAFDPETQSTLPTLSLDAGPRIEVHAIGANISQKVLRRYIPIFEEHAVDHDLIAEGSRNLRDHLQSEGFFDAQVEYKEQRVTNDRAAIDYLVNTGKRHRLVEVAIAGNRYFSTSAIRERMFLQKAAFLQFPHGRYSEALLRRDVDAITNLYQSNGFRDVKVTTRSQDDYRGKIGDLAVLLDIEEGPQYFVSSLTVDGIDRLNKAEILASLSSNEGQPFSEFNVAVDRDTILARYFENGFPNATFAWSSQPATQPHRMDLKFVIVEGDQQFVRQVVISGLGATRPSLVQRDLKLKAGDPLSPTAITDTQRRLYDLGVFEKVDAAIQDPDGDTPSKYVLYNMTEAHRYSMAVGVGAELGRIGGCQTCLDALAGQTGQTGFSPRVSFDITRNNMWGVAHSLSLRTRVSTLEQQALLNYSWPRFADNDALTLSFTGLYQQSRDIRTFNFKREEGSVQLSQRLSKATTLLYRYTYRRVSVDESTLKISPLLIPLLSQPVRLGLVSGNLIQDRRDDPLDPHKGIYNTLDFGLADRYFGSQRSSGSTATATNFLRFLARNATYHALGKKFVLARSTEFGDIHAFNYSGDALNAIPLPERFFAGGGTSNRGFPDFQAGPRDTSTGFPLGGTAILFNQTEIRFPLIGDNVGGVLFHDMGNVYSSLGNISFRVDQHNLTDFDYMVHAVGFGLRYRTPIGPVRFDLAYSINPPRFFGFKGSEQDLVNAGVNPCVNAPSQCVEQSVSHFQFFFSIGQTF